MLNIINVFLFLSSLQNLICNQLLSNLNTIITLTTCTCTVYYEWASNRPLKEFDGYTLSKSHACNELMICQLLNLIIKNNFYYSYN